MSCNFYPAFDCLPAFRSVFYRFCRVGMFFLFLAKKIWKNLKKRKKKIWTEQHVKHSFAGINTQHITLGQKGAIIITTTLRHYKLFWFCSKSTVSTPCSSTATRRAITTPRWVSMFMMCTPFFLPQMFLPCKGWQKDQSLRYKAKNIPSPDLPLLIENCYVSWPAFGCFLTWKLVYILFSAFSYIFAFFWSINKTKDFHLTWRKKSSRSISYVSSIPYGCD